MALFDWRYLVFLQLVFIVSVSSAYVQELGGIKFPGLKEPRTGVLLVKRSVGDSDYGNNEYDDEESSGSDEQECPRPKKEFWHPKYRKCVPFCRSGKRDAVSGLCLGKATKVPVMNEEPQYIPRNGQRMSPVHGKQMVYQSIRTKMENLQPRGRRG